MRWIFDALLLMMMIKCFDAETFYIVLVSVMSFESCESYDGKVACCPCLGAPCLPEACASCAAKIMPQFLTMMCCSCCFPLNVRLLLGGVYPSGDNARFKGLYEVPPLVERMERGGEKGRVLARAKFRIRTGRSEYQTLELTPDVIKMNKFDLGESSLNDELDSEFKRVFNQNSAYATDDAKYDFKTNTITFRSYCMTRENPRDIYTEYKLKVAFDVVESPSNISLKGTRQSFFQKLGGSTPKPVQSTLCMRATLGFASDLASSISGGGGSTGDGDAADVKVEVDGEAKETTTKEYCPVCKDAFGKDEHNKRCKGKNCAHAFCASCVGSACNLGQGNACPICSAAVTIADITTDDGSAVFVLSK